VPRQYQPEELRLFILSSHYRSPLNYGAEQLEASRAALQRLYTALRGLDAGPVAEAEAPWRARFAAAMDDDFNTPEAFAVLFELAREVNRARDAGEAERARGLAASLRHLGGVLGLLQADPERYLAGLADAGEIAEIERLVRERREARAARDFARADRIRDTLAERGIALEDGPGGTTWRRL